MPTLFIPPLRTRLVLLRNWTFPLHAEGRNLDMMKHLKVNLDPVSGYPYWGSRMAPTDVTLPAGTVLSVDRYYIKNGATDFDSVTFRATFAGMKKTVRFWAKLKDVNTIECEVEAPKEGSK